MAVLLVFQSCGRARKETAVLVAASANVRIAMEDIARAFQERTGISCEIISSSSGKLTAQIREGAPFDLLVSADRTYPDALHAEGRTQGSPKVYAYGRLILWTPSEGMAPDLETLSTSGTGRIAIAQPEIAPYGRATQQALEYHGLERSLQDRLIYGESIAQVNQFVASGAAEFGFTALSTVMVGTFSQQGRWIEIDPRAYAPIEQAACLLTSREGPSQAAVEFYEYLFSDAAGQILKTYGYDLPGDRSQ